MQPVFTDLDYGITAIDTDYLRPLFDASHLIVHQGRAAFVDTGTSHSVPRLLAVLEHKGLGPDAVDYILLTHIHLDHAGGAGALARELPGARVVVHPRGARHLADPTKLIAGTKAVYGEELYRELYGDIVPIAEQRIQIVDDGDHVSLAGRRLEVIHTEGHARHHYCLVDHEASGVFSGDSFGLSYREFDTPRGEFIFPTTTPVHFDPEAAHASVDRIMSFRPDAIYLTHYSRVTDLERLAADMHTCLDAFVSIALECAERDNRAQDMRARMYDFLAGRLDDHGVDADPDRRHALLDKDVELNVQGLEVWLERRGD